VTLLASYNADEAIADATVVDRTGSGNDFTLTGTGVTRVAGHTGNGLSNTGNFNPAFPPNVGQTANRTMMLWLKGPNTTAGWSIQWYISSIDSGSWGILNLSGSIHIQARSSSTLARASFARPSDISTVWHHIAGTYDGSNIRLYFDGVLKATTALAGPLRTDGVLQLFGVTESDIVDDIRIYDEVLDATAISALSAQPVDIDTGFAAFL
jgi:hypothetical protein